MYVIWLPDNPDHNRLALEHVTLGAKFFTIFYQMKMNVLL